jgi:hypothetical protein
MLGESLGLVWPGQGCWMHWPPPRRGGGSQGGFIVCQGHQSSNELNASLWFGHFADNIFWGSKLVLGQTGRLAAFLLPPPSRGGEV